ncbi:Carbonic anhydrase, putative [Perkinsus marinus ATCC 50983]|uniref:carbonic anhydrase n=2 Tax=Perkinsus marinus (strain ATCC 50983 / TXsc) TaxID=423536 RepID=C5LTV5_PERM5|nr:Carbonic anhydrase, putative [Perkinsus marinus ATCC 50983]EEQ99753.1 Carbonic anhydrase, putative [Perkinsus marinus ATCC 50983]|eukprot:XP_002767036.1 Carbonic anhydrase, putative [Perkinsus marinus ATCC 50983]
MTRQTHPNNHVHSEELLPEVTGQRQSPINIQTPNAGVPPFSINYGIARGVTVHAEVDLALEVPDANNFTVRGVYGLGEDIFRLTYMDMHWSMDSSRGSEHQFNGTSYAFEYHFANYNSKYRDFAEALEHSDGVVAIGVLYTVGDPAPGLNEVLDSMNDSNMGALDSFNVEAMIPQDLSTNFYLYNGSGTTPDCEEVMVWVVAKTIQTISEDQLNRLRTLRHNGVSIGPNYRQTQALNGRRILDSTLTDNNSVPKPFRASWFILILIIIVPSLIIGK